MGDDRQRSLALQVAVVLPWTKSSEQREMRLAQARLDEATGLARSIALNVIDTAIIPIRTPRPATLFGQGQVSLLAQKVDENQIGLVVVDARLTPIQQRNLERALNCKIIDRTGLILDIFGARARTREGVLQVELAHLAYQRSRLVRLWTHLERQRGGFGFLGGPGETQIEADRRIIDERLIKLKKEIEQVRRTRGLHRVARERVPFPVVALVGYTNAGKSTLFNRLTGSSVTAADQLFATLDPTMRGLRFASGRRAILSDTVGFVSDLPTELIAAFRATLEEVAAADIILHVRDIAHPDTAAQRADVLGVLEGLAKDGLLDANWAQRVVEVHNKIDQLCEITEVESNATGFPVSALTGEGVSELSLALDALLAKKMEIMNMHIPVHDGAALAWLYARGEIVARKDGEEMIDLTVRLFERDSDRFAANFPQYCLTD